jgi:hypothetical protein
MQSVETIFTNFVFVYFAANRFKHCPSNSHSANL